MSGAGPASPWRRRLIWGGVILGGAAIVNAGPLLRSLLPAGLEFEALETPPGFRRLAAGGGVSTGGAGVLVGLDAGPKPPRTAEPVLLGDLCARLFGGATEEGVVPIASFSDYYCPYCRVLARRLEALETGGGVRIAWHEWPLFGETSEAAARAALAAGRQGAYREFHDALGTGGFVPTEAFVRDLADRLGLDAARLAADMHAPEVDRALADARGLAGLFGFIGTPALVVGRTAVSGAVDEATLAALVEAEREAGPPPGCA
ncbi:MAG TPA: DsbA family protein [Paracoccaceae bacterium]|nr:DsbA family protein [Paracoccaceae bacterium]